MKMTEASKKQLINTLATKFGKVATRKDLIAHFKAENSPIPNWLVNGEEYRSSRGYVSLIFKNDPMDTKETVVNNTPQEVPAMVGAVVPLRQKKLVQDVDNLIPLKDDTYVPFGFFKDAEQIIKSKAFYPLFITGLSGNGKTTMVEQVCAKLNRECIRVNVSIETDEDDLIGGNTLLDGNVVFREGPVITAMRRGAILLIDEIDRGSNKLMCMQGILEGKPFYNKKTGEMVHPTKGFNIIATANTKGRGTDDGKFIAAQLLDEAFLERFPITVEQEYPTAVVERKIVVNNMKALDKLDEEFADKLVNWAEVIRKTYMDGAIDELISTRRLVHIVKAYSVFDNHQKAINLCINRFDDDTKTAFLDLYTKMSEPKEEPQVVAPAPHPMDDDIPF